VWATDWWNRKAKRTVAVVANIVVVEVGGDAGVKVVDVTITRVAERSRFIFQTPSGSFRNFPKLSLIS
jgi:hypothetical protein